MNRCKKSNTGKKKRPIELDTSEYILLALSDEKDLLYSSSLHCKNEVFRYPDLAVRANDENFIVIMNIDNPTAGEDITDIGYKILGSNSLELFGARLMQVPTYIQNCGKADLNVVTRDNSFLVSNDGKLHRIRVGMMDGRVF